MLKTERLETVVVVPLSVGLVGVSSRARRSTLPTWAGTSIGQSWVPKLPGTELTAFRKPHTLNAPVAVASRHLADSEAPFISHPRRV